MTTPLGDLRATIVGLFDWLAHVKLAPAGKGLVFRTADALLHLEDDGAGPKVARVSDDETIGTGVLRLYRDTISGTLYGSTSLAAPYGWTPIATGIIPPTPADAGTAFTVATGSTRVTCG